MNFDAVKQILDSANQPPYRIKSLVGAIQANRLTDYDQLSSWPKTLRQALKDQLPFTSYSNTQLISGTSQTKKALLELTQGGSIETVLIPIKDNQYSVCVSSQVGCAMGCSFCATGTLGLSRSLTAEEITDQIFFWKLNFPEAVIKTIVFMGMGEPFANELAVNQAIDWLQTYYGIGARHITVSTCGLIKGIENFAHNHPQVNLAISLHAATQELRQQLMPIANKVDLEALSQAIHQYLKHTNRRITFEYLLIDSVNDSSQNLKDLADWLAQFPLQLVHVNLIRYNQTTDKYQQPSNNRVYFARDYLMNQGIVATIRKSYGDDIAGACGQLSRKQYQKEEK